MLPGLQTLQGPQPLLVRRFVFHTLFMSSDEVYRLKFSMM
jgi:hypothetical protein